MDEDEYNKKSTEKEKNFEDFSIDELVKEINSLKKELKYLEILLKNKKAGKDEASEIFKK